jgi:8-oxo-dGTP pyrophosphatase MutT (NUDIX family)
MTLPPCDLEWGHDGDMHGNGGDGFYAEQHLEEHHRRQAERKKTKHSAIALVQRSDGRLLVVWNRRYGGWSLPGGMVEADEDPPEACTRELREETGLFGMVTRELYVAPARASTVVEGRATIVHVFEVAILGANSFTVPQPTEQEEGCPVSWFTREDFLRWSPFAPFYCEMFVKIARMETPP